MKKVKEEFRSLLHDIGIFCKRPCAEEENEQFILLKNHKQDLPEGIYQFGQESRFYRLVKDDIAEEDIDRIIMLKQIKVMNNIKNTVIIFALLILVSIVVALSIK
jgi:hypothetical protein